MNWHDILAGLSFGGLIIWLFLVAHFAALALSEPVEPDLTAEQEAIWNQLLEQPR